MVSGWSSRVKSGALLPLPASALPRPARLTGLAYAQPEPMLAGNDPDHRRKLVHGGDHGAFGRCLLSGAGVMNAAGAGANGLRGWVREDLPHSWKPAWFLHRS